VCRNGATGSQSILDTSSSKACFGSTDTAPSSTEELCNKYGWDKEAQRVEARARAAACVTGGPYQRDSGLVLEPQSKTISQEDIESELNLLRRDLIDKVADCMELHRTHNSLREQRHQVDGGLELLTCQQQLVALHKELLRCYSDLFLCSQHPSASPRSKQSVVQLPFRMWREAIYLLLRKLDQSKLSNDCLVSFLYPAYQMVTLLYETIPAFRKTWMKLLGRLAKWCKAIEDEAYDRGMWDVIASVWESEATNMASTVSIRHRILLV
jgi:hypothetical protein